MIEKTRIGRSGNRLVELIPENEHDILRLETMSRAGEIDSRQAFRDEVFASPASMAEVSFAGESSQNSSTNGDDSTSLRVNLWEEVRGWFSKEAVPFLRHCATFTILYASVRGFDKLSTAFGSDDFHSMLQHSEMVIAQGGVYFIAASVLIRQGLLVLERVMPLYRNVVLASRPQEPVEKEFVRPKRRPHFESENVESIRSLPIALEDPGKSSPRLSQSDSF